jgi:hypothetical protein
MTKEKLTALLAERVMGWSSGPERFQVGQRSWITRWRFQPAEKIEDAFRLLEKAAPQHYVIRGDEQGTVSVEVQVAGAIGKARGTSKPGTLTLAVARAVGIEVAQ